MRSLSVGLAGASSCSITVRITDRIDLDARVRRMNKDLTRLDELDTQTDKIPAKRFRPRAPLPKRREEDGEMAVGMERCELDITARCRT